MKFKLAIYTPSVCVGGTFYDVFDFQLDYVCFFQKQLYCYKISGPYMPYFIERYRPIRMAFC